VEENTEVYSLEVQVARVGTKWGGKIKKPDGQKRHEWGLKTSGTARNQMRGKKEKDSKRRYHAGNRKDQKHEVSNREQTKPSETSWCGAGGG